MLLTALPSVPDYVAASGINFLRNANQRSPQICNLSQTIVTKLPNINLAQEARDFVFTDIGVQIYVHIIPTELVDFKEKTEKACIKVLTWL